MDLEALKVQYRCPNFNMLWFSAVHIMPAQVGDGGTLLRSASTAQQ